MIKEIIVDGYVLEPSFSQRIPTLMQYPVFVRRFKRGEMMVRYQDPIGELQFMAAGRAKVFSVMGNGRAVLHTVFQGFEVIGDLEFLQGYRRATTDIQAVSDVVLLCIPLGSCGDQLLQDDKMLRVLGNELAKKLERSSRQGAQNLLYPLSDRLAAYLLFSAQEGIFSENLTQTSELLATSYRHLLRTLKGFCEQGLIRRIPRGYEIVDRRSLGRIGEALWWE